MAPEPTPKFLTIEIDVDMTRVGTTVSYQRAAAAYEAAVKAATAALEEQLPEDSITAIDSRLTWAYRWADERHPRYRRAVEVEESM